MQTSGARAHNWAGNITFGAARLHRPRSLDELRHIVAGAQRAHVLGSGHSFNRIADTEGDLLRVDGLPRRVEIDETRGVVTLSAGLRYGELATELHAAGFALANLASLPHISVAGSVATGTHGSGNERRGLASAVTAMEFVGADGETFSLSRESDPGRFPGAVVHLGALGVVTALTLEVEPAFEVAQWVYPGVPVGTVAAGYPEISASAYSVSVFTDWHSDTATVLLKRRLDREAAGHPGESWLGGRLAAGPWHPIPGMPATYCTEQGGVPGPWHERLPHFRPEFTPSGGEELQSELFLPRTSAGEAVGLLREMAGDFAGVLQVSEIRTIAAEDLWLSPAEGRDSMAFHFTWVRDMEAVLPVLAAVEARLLPLGARPHWGKVTTATPATVAERFPRLADFRRLADSLDPEGCFRNAFLDGLLAAAP
ncbi:FAD-binding protein [Streptomyces triticirhizae]|uniref:FAD-binding protein n=1 Tax=Streptomyces triticirhizae TaxID=2483353 RepID=A0A3M2LK56_9ACTN|nr:FAD-binding protein [Streptomyces triticirhizae]RMI36913.1 FAD-binding protein [Streptomyces triticirhizae]